jgi:transposase
MRFYTRQHKHYCGIDLHARSMYLCIIDQQGEILLHRNMRTTPEAFLKAVAPYREDLVVGVECIFTWYWLSDLCAVEGIQFVLGHALYMKAIHGGKAKNDKIDSNKIAALLRGGTMPRAYVYPPGMRATRDLLRRRLHFKRKRGELLAHIENTNSQYNHEGFSGKLTYRCHRQGAADRFEDASARMNINVDLETISYYDDMLRELERFILDVAREQDAETIDLLRTVPGIGRILSLVIFYEIHDIDRFKRHQELASYSRLVKCQRESAGKVSGTGGNKIGNVHLKWAFSEAAIGFLHRCPGAKAYYQRLVKKHGKGKALTVLAHKISRAVYYIWKRKEAFDEKMFLKV